MRLAEQARDGGERPVDDVEEAAFGEPDVVPGERDVAVRDPEVGDEGHESKRRQP